MTKKRVDWIDMARGYGMLFVIAAHCSIGILGKWMYTFHLPLFFMLSGYVFSHEQSVKEFLLKKAKTILVPYFLLGIPLVIFQWWENYSMGYCEGTDILYIFLQLLVQKRMSTLWFLACLFCVQMVFYFLAKYIKDLRWIGLVCLSITLLGYVYYLNGGGSLPWNFDTSWMAISFFYIGYAYKKKRPNIDRFLDNKRYSIPLFVLMVVLNLGLAILNHQLGYTNLEMFYSSYGMLPLVYGSAVAGCVGVIIFCKWFTFPPVRYIGANSMLYFAWHQAIFMPLMSKLLLRLGWAISETTPLPELIAYKMVYILLIVVVITALNMIISNTRLRFVLGK